MRARLERLLGIGVADVRDLGSSHSWTLHRASLDDGREVFVKAAADQAGVFAAEAAGLRWLGEAGPGTPVPEVLGADDRLLLLPWLPSAAPSRDAAERLGRELAALHTGNRPDAYGAPWDGFIADLPLDNTLDDGGWPRWYAERRLEPFLRIGARHLSQDDVRLIERVMAEIEELAGPPEPPSRIHGDLWSGNVQWTDDRALLIDPAAHGGHRETDLAMMALFGTPHLDTVLAAYDEAAPLADGWRGRVPLHQLHPLLVHVALFGGSYRASLVDAARASLG
ncbi:fructosamine kinase family protein [Actinomadura sp. NAK00032]|uniref:fructosamine kinase family protein n=1 Tax=Actinomadura sp. NAK00032 TaxID=2742128 RepID=UPI0015910EC7|nr:fructosamine kinase family protein [Actinomadura sp. NAK00032]QKW33213.1 fructosamine kinase family protein [Actinomadura sp. NAK00032]